MEESAQAAVHVVASAAEEGYRSGVVDIARAIFLGLIALGTFVIASVNWRNDKNRRTIDLIRTLMGDPDMLTRTSRIYSYRRQNQGYADPYKNRPGISYAHDLICLLNFLDTACIEVKEKLVYEKIVRENASEIIVGCDVLINELDGLVTYNARERFPVLTEYIEKWAD